MNREIKFRGWHTVANKMFSAEEMAEDQLTLLPTGPFINVNGTSTKLSTIFPSDKFIPLQYTGLKDKNGIEIYEGDIVDLHPDQNDKLWHRKIVWDTAAFHCVQIHGKATHPLYFNKHMTDREWVVIGNIYQNPDLL
jgi:uncharacterized phage protein (TIGR01671 family)